MSIKTFSTIGTYRPITELVLVVSGSVAFRDKFLVTKFVTKFIQHIHSAVKSFQSLIPQFLFLGLCDCETITRLDIFVTVQVQMLIYGVCMFRF